MTRTTPLPLRFWPRVNKRGPEDCWEWTGQRHPSGYGTIKVAGMMRGAHRVAWELSHGTIPAGLFVCHSCDNPPCCNPAHLFLGTSADNTRDSTAKGRHRNPRLLGERNPQAKLTERDAEIIRLLCGRIGLTQREVARRYGVTQSLVSQIMTQKVWAQS